MYRVPLPLPHASLHLTIFSLLLRQPRPRAFALQLVQLTGTLSESKSAAYDFSDASLTSGLTLLPLEGAKSDTVAIGDFAYRAPAVNYWRRV